MRIIHVAYLCLSLLLMCSCGDDDENIYYDASRDAQIYSFSVSATHEKTGDSISRLQDSLRFKIFSRAVFSIDQKDGVVFNRDSLPYGLVPKKVMMTVAYNTTYGISKFEIFNNDSLDYVAWNSKDSVDFSKTPIKFKVTAPDGATVKEYTLKLNIYQRDPDLVLWQRVADRFPANGGKQKVLLHNDKFYSYSKSLTSVYLDTCSYFTPSKWGPESLSNLPLNVNTESICYMNGMFFAIAEDGGAYTSADGITWTQEDNGYDIKAIYGVLPKLGENVLLVAFKDVDGGYYFGITSDMKFINKINKVSTSPSDPGIKKGFPVDKFASITDYSSDAGRLVLTGGFDLDTDVLSKTWLVKLSGDVLEISPSVQTSFFEGEGVSLFFYNELLYTLFNNKMYYSRSWGGAWTVVPTKQELPANMPERKSQSLLVDDKNNIWIFGGISTETGETLSDVWRGRLNKLIVN